MKPRPLAAELLALIILTIFYYADMALAYGNHGFIQWVFIGAAMVTAWIGFDHLGRLYRLIRDGR